MHSKALYFQYSPKRAPEQKALLGRPNSHQYPPILELKPDRFKPQLSKSLTDEKVSKQAVALHLYTKAHFQREWGTCISSACHL